jgi:CheY-like chemotaxis protein
MAELVHPRQILLADDDKDDSLLFKDVLEELFLVVHLTVVYDGESLIRLLNELPQIPDILFLDLNMPKKNGLTCLSEIKRTEKLHHLPVVVFSTAYEIAVINNLYAMDAQYYIRKPNGFSALKKVIHQALILTGGKSNLQPSRDKFVLSA